MDRCPACNAQLKELACCPRCQADLSAMIKTEQTAKQWLDKAISYWLEKQSEESFNALFISLKLKKTTVAIAFRHFIIQQQCQDVLALLSEKKIRHARQHLNKMRHFFPYHQQIRQLYLFTDYLLIKDDKQDFLK